MPETRSIPVKDLKLDLSNFRTVHQANEINAVQAMVAISADRFWALMESLLDDGYLPTENILVLLGKARTDTVVKEGNRRIAALKIIHGYLKNYGIELPADIAKRIAALPAGWKTANREVPCAVYGATEAATVNRIVRLAHGKGEKAARDQWPAVARARHNRDANGASEPALDLLEKYLNRGKNLTEIQAGRWTGDYPLTVLEEAIKRIAPRCGATNSAELAKKYPSVTHRGALEDIIKAIGLKTIKFETIRQPNIDFAADYGLPPIPTAKDSSDKPAKAGASGTNGKTDAADKTSHSGKSSADEQTGAPAPTKMAALAVNDPKGVKRVLTKFKPMGDNRQKVVTLRNEAASLNLQKTPLAFCFLLRSMFEISASAYCADHPNVASLSSKKADGHDKTLAQILRAITTHLTSGGTDKAKNKLLHGAMTELEKPAGILSVTSMNQLVHNTSFSVTPGDVSVLFGNVFPLLSGMNE